MFKLFEKDKCVTLQLDLATVGSAGHKIEDIVPGTILYDGAIGAVDAVSTTDNGPFSITEATAGRYFIAMDYYANTMNHSYANTDTPGGGSYTAGSGKVAAIPVLEYFTAVIQMLMPMGGTIAKGDMLTITNGLWTIGDLTDDYVFAMVTETVTGTGGTTVDVKITTWCARYTQTT